MKKTIVSSIVFVVSLLLIALVSPVDAKKPWQVTNPVPTITTISPSSVVATSPAFKLTINGTNFMASSVVKFKGSWKTTTYVSGTQLAASISASDLTVAGTFNVTVTNPGPGGGTSNIKTFTITPVVLPPPPPSPPVPPLPPSPPPSGSLQIGAFNANVGTIHAYFDGWMDSPSCAPAGQQTFIYWENIGYSLDSIINGSQDVNINRYASKICPGTTLSVFAEMNGNWDEWGGTVGTNTPAKVIAAWKHIHDLIGNRVKYAWAVNDSSVPNVPGNQINDYYPGDAYVDIVGVSGFDWGGMTFMQGIAPAFPAVQSYNKPVWITSFGTAQTNQGVWITDAINQAKANNITGLIYFSYADGVNFTLNAQGLAAYHL